MSEGNSTGSLVLTVDKQHLDQEIPSIIFLWVPQSICLSNCWDPQETGKIPVSGHLHFSALHYAVNHFSIYFSLMLRCFLPLCKYSLQDFAFSVSPQLSQWPYQSTSGTSGFVFFHPDVLLLVVPQYWCCCLIPCACSSSLQRRADLQGPEEQTLVPCSHMHCPSIRESSGW